MISGAPKVPASFSVALARPSSRTPPPIRPFNAFKLPRAACRVPLKLALLPTTPTAAEGSRPKWALAVRRPSAPESRFAVASISSTTTLAPSCKLAKPSGIAGVAPSARSPLSRSSCRRPLRRGVIASVQSPRSRRFDPAATGTPSSASSGVAASARRLPRLLHAVCSRRN